MEHDAISDDVVRLSLPTRFLKSWVQSHYADKLLACWKAELPSIRRVDLVHRSAVLRDATIKVKPNEPIEAVRDIKSGAERELRVPHQPAQAAHEALGGSPLDPRLAFDTFVVGRSNTLAHAAAKQVALARRGEPVMFNPLYVHAGVGLGKTHLLQAIAWAGNGIADRKVLYLTAEKFMYGFVAALKSQTALAFKEALRGIDVLVIDDLQFLQGKSTQVEFCHTLNALIDARPPGRDRGRPSAERPGKPRRPRPLAARRRAGRRDGLARGGAAAGNPEEPGRGRSRPPSGLRCARAGARLRRQADHP